MSARHGRGRSTDARSPLQGRDAARYLAEIRPGADTPAGPCPICGDRVWFRLREAAPWLCRSCERGGCLRAWRAVVCRHQPQCVPPRHMRTAVEQWFGAPEREP